MQENLSKTKDQALGVLTEFKQFAMKGNVVDLAVGVIIGGAFGKIVGSLVEDVVMPLVGTLLGGLNFSALAFKVGEATIKYGKFIQTLLDFVIIAWAIFVAVKVINRLKRAEEAAPSAPPAPPRSEVLLEEIRDLLKR
jgi:large conductance mechanosensitive channel